MIQQCTDETVPVLVTIELQRESIAIVAPCELDGRIAEIAEAELERLAPSRFVVVDLSRCTELGRGGRALLVRVHAWLPLGVELVVVASSPDIVEALQASALGRSLPRYALLEECLRDLREIRAESVAAREADLVRPGLRLVDSTACYSADWL